MPHGFASSTDRFCIDPMILDVARHIERQWGLDCLLADLTAVVMAETERAIGRTPRVISGYRSRAAQEALRRKGRPTAPDDLSNHRVWPARGVDVSLGALPDRPSRWTFGISAMEWGLRWGGGSKIDPETGMPSDWQHLDLGPRPPGLESGP